MKTFLCAALLLLTASFVNAQTDTTTPQATAPIEAQRSFFGALFVDPRPFYCASIDVDVFLKTQEICLRDLGHHFARYCFEQALLAACKQPVLAPITQ